MYVYTTEYLCDESGKNRKESCPSHFSSTYRRSLSRASTSSPIRRRFRSFFDERKIILDNSLAHEYITSTLNYINFLKNHLNYIQTVNSSKSQNQTYTTLCSMDGRVGKHSTKSLRTDDQQTTTNIHVGGVEKLLSDVFLLLLSATEE